MKTKIIALKTLVGSALLVGATTAHAALPEAAQSAVDSVSSFAGDMVSAAWGIVVTVVVGFVGIKLFKKGVNKAS